MRRNFLKAQFMIDVFLKLLSYEFYSLENVHYWT